MRPSPRTCAKRSSCTRPRCAKAAIPAPSIPSRSDATAMTDLSRRELVALLGAAALGPRIGPGRRAPVRSAGVGFRVRTITAGTTLRDPGDHAPVDRALAFLARARQRFVAAGYEVQTVRVATQPLVAGVGPRERAAALPAPQALAPTATPPTPPPPTAAP